MHMLPGDPVHDGEEWMALGSTLGCIGFVSVILLSTGVVDLTAFQYVSQGVKEFVMMTVFSLVGIILIYKLGNYFFKKFWRLWPGYIVAGIGMAGYGLWKIYLQPDTFTDWMIAVMVIFVALELLTWGVHIFSELKRLKRL